MKAIKTIITNAKKKIQELLLCENKPVEVTFNDVKSEQESTEWKVDDHGHWTRYGWVLMIDGGFVPYDGYGPCSYRPGEARVFPSVKEALAYRDQNYRGQLLLDIHPHFATLFVKSEGEIGERRDNMILLYPSFKKALMKARAAIVKDGPGENSRAALVDIENVLACEYVRVNKQD